jgi:hypothetical protein
MTSPGQATTPEVRTLRRERAPGRPRRARSRRAAPDPRRRCEGSGLPAAPPQPRCATDLPVEVEHPRGQLAGHIRRDHRRVIEQRVEELEGPLTALVGRPSDGHPETDPGTDPRPARFSILPTGRTLQPGAGVRQVPRVGRVRRTERACRSRQGHISRRYRDALVTRHPGASAVRSNRSRSGRGWRGRRGIPDRRVSAGDGAAGRGGELPAGGRRLDEAAELETGQAAQDGERRDAGSDGDAVG